MNRGNQTRLKATLLVTTMVLTMALFLTGGAVQAADVIKVGLSCPLSGPVSWMGEDYTHGATLGIELVNSQGGVLGKQLKLYTADDACSPAQAAGSYRKLIDLDLSLIHI